GFVTARDGSACEATGQLKMICVRGGTWSPPVVVHPQMGDLSPLQANTTTVGRARISQTTRGGSTGPPDQSRHVTCGNDEDGEPGSGRTQGRTAAAAARRFIIREAQ